MSGRCLLVVLRMPISVQNLETMLLIHLCLLLGTLMALIELLDNPLCPGHSLLLEAIDAIAMQWANAYSW